LLKVELLRVFEDNFEVYGMEKLWRHSTGRASPSAGTVSPVS
jgi:hypothetical protein